METRNATFGAQKAAWRLNSDGTTMEGGGTAIFGKK
jgi:hypothetical protein